MPSGVQRIGLFGGTFDPPHRAHVAAAQAARRVAGLDRVLMVVANDPWLKSVEHPVSPAADRLALVEAAVAGIEGLEVSSIEIERGGPSYTIDTVRALIDQAGDEAVSFEVIIGADLVTQLDSWHQAPQLAALVGIVAVTRPGAVITPQPGWRVTSVEGPDLDISSSELRQRLELGVSVTEWISDPVIHCIEQRGMYAKDR